MSRCRYPAIAKLSHCACVRAAVDDPPISHSVSPVRVPAVWSDQSLVWLCASKRVEASAHAGRPFRAPGRNRWECVFAIA